MADEANTASQTEAAGPTEAEFRAFVDYFLTLSCRQREALMDLIHQIISLEAEGLHLEVARVLEDAPGLLRDSALTN